MVAGPKEDLQPAAGERLEADGESIASAGMSGLSSRRPQEPWVTPRPGSRWRERAATGRDGRSVPWAMRTPVTSRTAPASSARPGASPSSAHALAIATTGASRTQGTTCPDGYRESSRLKIAYPTREHSPAV